ncbi:Linear gramicidin synthase subunit B [Neonectria ditissima]|uniref:Linear gramicidin synthase subunit B n=1 Tax=Neonectria ditissima TaxID=78410 RepID=A0A0P7AVU8_9HYPO|nr:Linear gramicidin synthase subunit B [Neonectria ditissima]
MSNPPSAARFSLSSSSTSDSIPKLFEDAARSCPQRPAVQFEHLDQVTYRQLRSMVGTLAAELRGVVCKGQMVPVLLPRSVYQVCAILTLAKLGAVYVPLDVNMPASRLYSILSTTQATVVITESRFHSLFEGFNGPELRFIDPLNSLRGAKGQTCTSGPCLAADATRPTDLAAVLFTSGSTGQPKGVMLSHRNLIEPVRLLSQLEEIHPASRILQFASCAFDVHLLDIFCAMFNGATLCQVSKGNLASNLSGWVQDMAVDVAHLTPSVIALLEGGRDYSLKHMVTCGEPVTQGIIQDWGGRVNLINLYGPCEASSVLAMVLQPGSQPNVFGPPSSHASVHILDDAGTPVATGVEGEIYCSGDSVALGYLGDDAATERSFHRSGSFDLVPGLKGDVLHATGDWGRLTAAGELALLGRRDSQIKINGQRVDLGEIHAVVDSISTGAVILPMKGPTERMRLFAFLTNGRVSDRPPEILPHDSAIIRELYSACRMSLPSYAIPNFVLVSAIPLTPSGKVDEQKLFRMVRDRSRETPPRHFDLPFSGGRPCADTDISDLQEMLANMTAAPFSGDAPWIDDDLRYYGLTSIDFMLLIKGMSTTFGVSLTFQEVMRNPSIHTIAGILKEKLCQIGSDSWKDPATTPDAPTSTTPRVPASQSQGLILSAQSALQNHAYNCNFVIRVDSFPLDPHRLISGLRAVCARHEVLRSTYHEGDDAMAPAYFQKVHNISELEPVCRIHAFEASKTLQSGWPHISSTPVPNWIIHFNIHHVAIDEWGFSIVCRELESIYQAWPAQGRTAPSPLGTAIQYREFSQYQRNKGTHHQRQERLEWWLSQMDAETLEPLMTELHVHRPADALISLEKDTSLVYVQPLDARRVRAFENKQCSRSTPFIAWLTLCQVVLARMLRRSKFALAIPLTERGMDPAFQDLVGFCLNTLLIPVFLDLEATVANSLSTTQRTFNACVEHSLPLETVVHELNRSRALNDKAGPEVMFVYHDPGREDAMEASSAKGFLGSAEQLQLASVGSRFDFVVHYCSKLGSDDAHLKIEYRRSLFSRELVATMARSIDAALGDMVAYGNQRACANINYLSPFDEARILEWSAPSPLPDTMEKFWLSGGGILLHQLVESTAHKMPLATAVRTLDHTLTYSELMAKATSLCRRLQTVGSIVGTRVLIFLSKSVELVVAELAVLVGGRAVKSWIAEFLSLSDNRIKNQYSALGLGKPRAEGSASMQKIRETSLGRTLIECWATVFGVLDEQVNPDVPFLHVGGDSISAIRFVSRLRSQGVAGCAVSQLYESPTLTSLHTALEPLQAPSSRVRTGRTTSVVEDVYNGLEPDLAESVIMEATALGISRSAVKRVYPTTSMQKAMLLASASHFGLYTTKVTLHLKGPLDSGRMMRAWQAVCNAHPSMRTTFVSVRSRGIISFFSVEASGSAIFSLPDMVEGSVSQREIQQMDPGWERGFKLGDSMFQLIVVKNKDQCHKLTLSCHHASCDGWSLNIILRDLAQAYRGHSLVPSRPFSAVVTHLRDRSQSAARAYWQSYLEDYSHHSLAWDDRYASMDLQMKAATQTMDSVSSHVLAGYSRHHGVTPAVLLQAALAVLLSNVSGKDDVAFGQVVSGRHLPVDGVVDIVGDLLNIVPLRVTVDRDLEVGSWLKAVYQSSIESLEHHHILLEDIRRCTGGSELLETVFVFENHANQLDSSIFGSLELKSIDGQEFSNVPLTVVVEFVESGLMATFKFNEAVLPSWRVESMMRAYVSIVGDMLAGAAVSELGRLGLDEVAYVKEDFHLLDQQLENLGSHSLVSLLNTTTYALPDEVAIEEESRSVTFSELSRSSDAVCDYLVDAGIGLGQIVPILFDASVDMVVAMLGIMKSGAAYCPIDVDGPDLRIRQTVRQVSAKIMIGDQVNGDRLSEELRAEVPQVLHADDCKSLRVLVLGGERMSTVLQARWAGRLRLYDGYGPTECAVQVSTTLISPQSEVGVISKPLPGNVIILLDGHGRVPRVGEIGEICVGGCQVFEGYLNPADATQSSFRNCKSFKSPPLLGTGDLGVYRQDMSIQILGRKDTQVKLSGERIEVAEIESVIYSFAGVTRCAVLVNNNRLYAIVEKPNGASGPLPDQIGEWCLRWLPQRLVPRVLTWPSLPLTSSNKLNRKAILQQLREFESLHLTASKNAPVSETERSIASMITEICGREVTDVCLSLQHCGLNSLEILHLRSSMSALYRFTLELSLFWQPGTIRSLAEMIEARRQAGECIEQAGPLSFVDTLPASDSELTVWMAQKRYADNTYSIGRVLRFQCADVNRLFDSLHAVLESFDIFYLTFVWNYTTGTLERRLHSELQASLYLENVEDDGPDALGIFWDTIAKDYQRAFDLENGPLASFRIISPGPGDCYLYYNIHHVLVDEWTCEMIVEALRKQYRGIQWRETISPSWGSPTTRWEAESHRDEALEAWKQRLSGVAALNTGSRPLCRAPKDSRGHASLSSVLKVSPKIVNELQRQIHGKLSSFVSLLSIFQVLLHKYTASRNLVVLIPVSRRGFDVRTSKVIGNMTYTVALRSEVDFENDTFATFGQRTECFVAFARENSSVPVDKALGTISSAVREQSIMFVFSRAAVHDDHPQVSDVPSGVLPIPPTMFDLIVNVVERGNELSISAAYNSSRHHPSFIEGLTGSYRQCLEQLSQKGIEHQLRDLLRPSTDMLVDWEWIKNAAKPDSPTQRGLLHEAFQARSMQCPSSVAIDMIAGGQRSLVSYEELNSRSNYLSIVLQRDYGIVSGSLVPIFIDQTADLLIAVIGVLKAGAGYIPIPRDGDWPPERVCRILSQCHATVLISDTDVVTGIDINIHNIRSLPSCVQSTSRANCTATPDSIAFVLWTSGTTGEPKGVMMSHAAALSCVSSISGRLYPRSVEDRVFQFSSPVFDASVVDYFATLSLGATLCMMPRAELLTDIRKAVAELKPTTASLTPSVAQLLDPRAAQLHTLILSGEVVPTKTVERFICAGTTVINGYGTTESNLVTFTEMSLSKDARCIGKPLPDAKVIILDESGNLASAFVHGEICLRGRQLFSGYHGHSDNTKGAYVHHEGYGKLYRTGDIGYVDSSGDIIFCGRRDTQVKLYGQRLEPGLISDIIDEMTRVKGNSIAVVDEQLVAFLIDESSWWADAITAQVLPHGQEDVKRIRDYIQARVPSTFVPTVWVRISRLPLTTSGKLDVRKLAALTSDISGQDGHEHDLPENEHERLIHRCCVQVLGRPIGASTDMFGRGLDSYSAMMLLSRLREAIPGFQISFRQLMERPQVRELATLLQQQSSSDGAGVSRPRSPDGQVQIPARKAEPCRLPASSMQKRFCLAQDVFQDATYNVPGLFEIKDASHQAIVMALNAIVEEHDIFRTHFEFVPSRGGYQQVILGHLMVNASEYDLSDLQDSKAAANEMNRVILSDLKLPFNTGASPLFRCKVFKKPAGKTAIFFNFHHTIADEQSLRLLVSDLYCRVQSRVPLKPHLNTAQYGEFCAEEELTLIDETRMHGAMSFWREHLKGMEGINLQMVSNGTKGPDRPSLATFFKKFSLPKRASSWTRGQSMTDFSAYLTYFQMALAASQTFSESAVLIPISQRRARFGESYGCYLNTVPVRFALDSTASLRSALGACNRALLDVMDHSFVPYEAILDTAGLGPDAFPVMFVYHEGDSQPAGAHDIGHVVRGVSGNVRPKFLVTFSLTVKPAEATHELEVSIDYDRGRVSATTVQSLCDRFPTLIDSAQEAAEEAIIGQLAVLTDKEQGELRAQTVQTLEGPLTCVHDLIERQVRKSPGNTAACFEGTIRMTYQDLWSGIRLRPAGYRMATSQDRRRHSGRRSKSRSGVGQQAPWQSSTMKITHLATTPSICALIRPETCPTIEVLAIGGEPMTKTVQGIWSQATKLLNVYGPSETTVNVTCCQVRPGVDVGIIGKPLKNVRIHILNDQLQEVPPGGVGQLAVGGAQLARGYTDKNLDQGSFVEHPRLGRLFLTGDFAHLTDDTSIRFRGRKDHQVKLRGQRIELEEVERVVGAAAPNVRSSVAFLVKSGLTEAFQDPHDVDTQNLASRLEESLRSQLPHYAVAQYWVPTTGIPMLANGKLNRRLVRSVISDMTAAELDRFRITRQCTDVFKDSNFFALAGDSISAIRLCSHASYHGIRLLVSNIYEAPVLEQLALLVQHSHEVSRGTGAVSAFGGTIHLTPIMEWFFGLRKHNINWYNQSAMIRLRGSQDLEQIPSAWETVVQTHPSLRIRYLSGANHLDILEPSRKRAFSIRRTKFPSFSSLLAGMSDVASDLDIAAGRVSSLGLFQTPDEAYCVFCVHHLAVDIVSWQIILDDLRRLLRGQEIWPESATFEDWSQQLVQRQQRQARADPGPDVTEDGCHPNLALAPNFPDMAHLNTVAMAKVANFEAPEELPSSLLNDASRTVGVEPVDLLLASLLLAFQRWKDIPDIEICVESHGRDLKNESLDVSRTIGWFTSMAHVRFSLLTKCQTRMDELVREVNDRRLFALETTDLAGQLPAWNSHVPVVTFNYYGSYADSDNELFDLVDVGSAAVDEDPSNVRFALLDVGCSVSNGRLGMNMMYSASIYKEEEVQKLLHLWCNCLADTLQDLKGYDITRRLPRHRRFPSLLLAQDQIDALIHHGLEPFGIEQSMIQDIAPATDMQKSMVLASLEFGSYIESFTYRIDGAFEIDQFIRAWSAVISKHAALRSRFIRSEILKDSMRGEILQVILSPDRAPSILTQGSETPTPLEFGYGEPTMRMHLYRTDDGAYWFNWDFHHALIDGWSTGIIMRDFEFAYLSQPTPRVVSFETVRNRLRELAESHEMLSFWKEELGAARPSRLVDYSSSASSLRHHVAPQDWRHDQTLSCPAARVQACAAAELVTVSTMLRAAWAMALSRFGGGGDKVVFGVTTSGRNLGVLGIEEIVGPCINTVPLRIHMDYQSSRKSFLQEVHSKSALLIRNDALSLHQIYRASGVKNLFDTVFLYQNYAKSRPDANLTFTMKLLKAVEKTDIPVNMLVSQDSSGHLHAAALVHRAHISSAFLECLVTAFDLALTWLCDSEGDREPRLVDLDLLSPETRQQVDEFGRGPPLGHSISTAWQLISQQANRTPERLALEFYQGQRIQATSYGELLWKTEKGAQYLHKKQGIGRGDKVAVFLDKSPSLVLTMLSLFRLGAICVPLRYKDPDVRLARLLREADPKLLVLSGQDQAKFSGPWHLCLVEYMASWQPENGGQPLAIEGPTTDDAAFVLFTSGTTGLPKGVLMPSRQIVGYAVAMAEAYCYDQSPTEAGVIAWVDAGPEADPRCVGHVVPGMQVMILDDNGRKLPVGVQGTIYTAGSQLSLGYLDRPDLTRKLFAPNPYSPTELMYNTGDLGAFDSFGRLMCFGRKDHQVKVHGQRVELGEIEDALSPNHRVVAVQVIHSDMNQGRIVAFFESEVTPKDELRSIGTQPMQAPEAVASKLDALARRTLPSYMVPTAFVPVQSFPLTANGKADRNRLQELFVKEHLKRSREVSVPALPLQPMSETESRISKTIAELLGLPSVSADVDSFSSLLDSLSSMSLAAKLRTVFKQPVRLHWILDSNTVRDLAFRIDSWGVAEEPFIENGLQVPKTVQFTHAAGRNVFCIHPASGISFVFKKLAALLPEVNTIGVNDPCFGDMNAYQSVYEMAERYLGSILSHQPSGHFVLIGYSFGAHIATEVARLLHNFHHPVQLILVDSSVQRGALARFADPRMADKVYKSFKPDTDSAMKAEEGKDFLYRLEREVSRNLQLMARYQMKPFPWPATFLRASENKATEDSSGDDDSNGYRGLVAELAVEHVCGEHYQLFEDRDINKEQY